jgi:hypothetical protein
MRAAALLSVGERNSFFGRQSLFLTDVIVYILMRRPDAIHLAHGAAREFRSKLLITLEL